MIKAFSLALVQIGDRNTLRLLAKTIAITLLIFVMLGAGLYFAGSRAFAAAGWGFDDSVQGYLAGILAAVVTILAVWLWFRAVAIGVLQVFGDDIVMTVERTYYPHVADRAEPVGFRRGLGMGMKSLVRALLLNLVALPFYIALFFTAIGLPIAFLIVNALLLGRDLQEIVVARHSDNLKDSRLTLPFGTRFALGFVVAGLFVVPFVNLFAPIIGAAMATHLVHSRENSDNNANAINE